MAEGLEEADNSNSCAGDATTSMLSAAMPCEMREFESYHHQAFSNTKGKSHLNRSPIYIKLLTIAYMFI